MMKLIGLTVVLVAFFISGEYVHYWM